MIIENLLKYLWQLWSGAGVDLKILPLAATVTAAILLAVALWVIFRILVGPVSAGINRLVAKTETKVDDILLSPKIMRALCLMVISFLLAYMLPRLGLYYPSLSHALHIGARVVVITAVTYVALLESTAFCTYLRHGDNRKSGVLVLRNILTTLICAVSALLIISTILNRELAYIISALGAMAAVLMLVFKDSILGMIAGIRLTVNGMLHENDWVTVPAYNADGRVEDVSLTAVKIRNWDKSVSTIPPYALVSGGFTNRESMLSLGVRQIRRNIRIDATSVQVLSSSQIEKISRELNATFPKDVTINLSLFRRYLRNLLLRHPRRVHPRDGVPLQVHVRELEPTAEGIPVELFFFVDCLDWEEFEQLQADLIDQTIATLKIFNLRSYQKPSGADVALIGSQTARIDL